MVSGGRSCGRLYFIPHIFLYYFRTYISFISIELNDDIIPSMYRSFYFYTTLALYVFSLCSLISFLFLFLSAYRVLRAVCCGSVLWRRARFILLILVKESGGAFFNFNSFSFWLFAAFWLWSASGS